MNFSNQMDSILEPAKFQSSRNYTLELKSKNVNLRASQHTEHAP